MAASELPSQVSHLTRRRFFLAIAACVLVFEFGVARQPVVREAVLDSAVRQVEHQTIAPAPPPQAIVFGNSRMLYGVDERQLADQAALSRSAVLKLTMNGSLIADYLYLYQRNRSKLSHSRYVIIGIDDWDVAYSYHLRPKDIYDTALLERLTVPDWRYAPLGVITWACQSTYMLRSVLYYSARKCRSLLKQCSLRGGDRRSMGKSAPRQSNQAAGLFDERDPVTERLWATGEWYRRQPAARSLLWSPRIIMDRHCGSLPSLGDGGRRQLQRLVDMCTQDGATVLIVRPPLRDDYLQLLAQRYPPYAQAFDVRAAEIERWARSSEGRVQVRIYGAGSGLGLPSKAFYDYGHPSPLGRTFLTSELAKWLRLQGAGRASS